ncbi:hypothetical protein SASPL_105264 [Salvia splendens]|uniref:Disease resistance protein RPM1 n=1 Tax=Salvia splendens TaxID=180675 RepID=A0A8X9ABF6_SALSN|nr:hypothetical protein SASPL_105264 [Salvia splendens]
MFECYSVHNIEKEACDIIPSLHQLTKELKSELDQQGSSYHSKQKDERLLRQTYAHDFEPDFIGMEKDIQLLVSKVLDETRRKRIVKIYGMGGLRKTTLARQFEHKDVFDKILKQLDKDINVDGLEVEDLVTRIQSFLKERKCLVVIDVLW